MKKGRNKTCGVLFFEEPARPITLPAMRVKLRAGYCKAANVDSSAVLLGMPERHGGPL